MKAMGSDDLTTIPKGFKNNILWNIAHSITIQQRLAYSLSGEKMHIPEDFVEKYGNGSVPEENITAEEINRVESLLFSPLEKTKEDYEKGIFKTFTTYTTSAKITLKNIDDAILFNSYHEGLHLGYIFAIRKALSAS